MDACLLPLLPAADKALQLLEGRRQSLQTGLVPTPLLVACQIWVSQHHLLKLPQRQQEQRERQQRDERCLLLASQLPELQALHQLLLGLLLHCHLLRRHRRQNQPSPHCSWQQRLLEQLLGQLLVLLLLQGALLLEQNCLLAVLLVLGRLVRRQRTPSLPQRLLLVLQEHLLQQQQLLAVVAGAAVATAGRVQSHQCWPVAASLLLLLLLGLLALAASLACPLAGLVLQRGQTLLLVGAVAAQ